MFHITFKKLGEIAEIYNGVREERYEKGYTIPQKVFQLQKPDFELNITTKELSEDISKKYYSKKGDLILNLSQPVEIFLIKEEGVIIGFKFAIIRLREGYDSYYIYQILENKKEIFSRLSEGSILRFLKISDLKNLKLDLPNFEEQKRQGKLLRLLDKKISKEKEMIDKQIKFKKAIIGETNVKL